MTNYQNGKIYKIESLSMNLVYYGSTTQSLCKRLSKHRSESKRSNITSKQVLQYDDAKIYLVFDIGN